MESSNSSREGSSGCVEPFLCRHYDRMERRDPLKASYDIEKPHYEYNK